MENADSIELESKGTIKFNKVVVHLHKTIWTTNDKK